MTLIEWLADRLPPSVTRPASVTAAVLAIVGSGCLFAATVLGSILWGVLGVVAFALAGVLWNVVAVASEARPVRAPAQR